MDYLSLSNDCLHKGQYLLGLGAFLTTLGWFLLGIHKPAEKWLSKCWPFKHLLLRLAAITFSVSVLIIAGTNMLAEGASLTTRAWNLRGDHGRKQAQILAAAAAWKMNDMNLQVLQEAYRVAKNDNYEDLNVFAQFTDGPSLEMLGSGLFMLSDPEDAALVIAVADYDMKAKQTNQILEAINNSVAGPIATQEFKKNRIDGFFREKGPYSTFADRHNTLRDILTKNHPWVFEDLRRINYYRIPHPNASSTPD
jgi:hypothetical protein